MVNRTFWHELLEKAWRRKSVIWLSGVRRVGKTTLVQSLPGVEYFDCELPSVRRRLDDPEAFLDSLTQRRIALDEVHRLGNPSQLLKIAADHFPHLKVLATGSSTLGASAKFKDTLTGRKQEIWLTPMILEDMGDFKNPDLNHRFLFGGLPPYFLSETLPESDFQEWMDSFWAKDVQELFRLERRYSFQKFTELLLAQSGGLFEATKFTAPCEVSRGTITNYLKVLEATFVVHVIRPFSTHRPTEIVSAPKVYGFDTGFVCLHRGWSQLRPDDMGILWEHFVLNEIHAHFQSRDIRYWRDKKGHEVDFLIPLKVRSKKPIPIECKWTSKQFDGANFKSFSLQYKCPIYYVVCADIKKPYTRRMGENFIRFVGLHDLIAALRLSPLVPRFD